MPEIMDSSFDSSSVLWAKQSARYQIPKNSSEYFLIKQNMFQYVTSLELKDLNQSSESS